MPRSCEPRSHDLISQKQCCGKLSQSFINQISSPKMSEAKTRPQYVYIDVVKKDQDDAVSICGPRTVVVDIKNRFRRNCIYRDLGNTAKLTIVNDYRLTKASFLEEVLQRGFTLLSDLKDDSLVLSREVKL